jgi:transcriptional regulator with XRE-family HTH domain
MFEEFICDLKIARKRSGLTQSDCGHLVGTSDDIISQIERGQRLPTIRELVSLSLIYGKSFDGLYAEILKDVRRDLVDNLGTVPSAPKGWARTDARTQTLSKLARRLEEEATLDHGA